jgi:hypothetical protein
MPPVRTAPGDRTWDQDIGTIGQLLFPDQGKAAQAYYYGTESRKGQLESNKIIGQQNWENRLMMGQNWGPGVPQPAPPTWSTPSNVPNAAPIVNSPANLPLSSAVTAPMPSSDQIATTAAATPALLNPYTQGTPPPASSPAPGAGAPPAPTTTASNGATPSNDPMSGVFRAGSTATGGGGPIAAGPANPNGSPAQMPFDLQKYVAMAVASGMDAAKAQALGAAYVAQMAHTGVLAKPQVNQAFAGAGVPQPLVADINATSARETTGMNNAGAMARTVTEQSGLDRRNQADLAEKARQFNTATKATVDDQGNPIHTPQDQLAGKRWYEPQVAATVAGENARAANKTITFMDPAKPGRTIQMNEQRGIELGLQPAPTTLEGAQAPIGTAIFNAPPDQAPGLVTRRDQAFPPTTKPSTATKADEYNDIQSLMDQTLAQLMPAAEVKTSGWWSSSKAEQEPAWAAAPALGQTFTNLVGQYLAAGPTKGDPIASTQAAFRQMVDEKYINPNQKRTTAQNVSIQTKEGLTNVPRHLVNLVDPTTGQLWPADKAPPTLVARIPASSVVAPAATPAAPAATQALPAPGTVIEPAPGVPEGTTANGGKFIARGGNWVVQ